MKCSDFSEKAKNGDIVYYTTLSGESENGKWSNRIATIKDRLKMSDLMAKMTLVSYLGTSRVLRDTQRRILEAVVSVSEITTEKVIRKKGIDIDLQTNKVLEEDKETCVLKEIKCQVSDEQLVKLIERTEQFVLLENQPQAEESTLE